MLAKMKLANYNDTNIKKVLRENIKNYRKIIIKDPNAKKSSKISGILSYFSIDLVILLRNSLKK